VNPMVFPPSDDGPKTARMCTPEEADLLHWLLAERDWKGGQAELKYMQDAREAQRQKHDWAATEHNRVLAGATGLRHVLLELHRPHVDEYDFEDAKCWECGYFTCKTYALARDWEGA
jgi:hypothetical protein